MSEPSLGDAAQTRKILEQAIEATIIKVRADHPELYGPKEAEIPAPLKWIGVIIAGLFTMGTATLVFWLVSSVSAMQVTLARMDERMASGMVKDARYEDINRRVTILETYQAGGKK